MKIYLASNDWSSDPVYADYWKNLLAHKTFLYCAVAIVHMGEVLLGAAAYHLVVVAATAGRLHIVILVVIHLMLMGKSCVLNYLNHLGSFFFFLIAV